MARVDQVGEEGDAVLKVRVHDLHDARRELQDADVGRLLHLGHGVEEAICWYTSVGIDEQDIIANSDIAVGPCTTVLLECLLQRLLIRLSLIMLAPLGGAVDGLQLLLDNAGNIEGVVHIRRLLELALALEAILAMLGTSHPANAVVGIKLNTRLTICLGNELQTVIVDEHVGRPALQFVRRHGLLDGLDSGHDDALQTLLVHRTLDGDVGKR